MEFIESTVCRELKRGIALRGRTSGTYVATNAERKTRNRHKHKNKPLTHWEKKFNKLIGKTRFKVERTFGGIKRWFNRGTARYRGIHKMHTQNLMEAMSYNLYRSPGIIASNSKN